MNLEGIAKAVERHLADLSDPTEPQKDWQQIGRLMGLSAAALICLLILGFFINLALVSVAGVGIGEAAFGKIAIAVMVLALPVLFGGTALIVVPAIAKELSKAKTTTRERFSPKEPPPELPSADRFDAISSVTEHTTAESELPPQTRAPEDPLANESS
jgi:hypothetical protein